MMTMSWFTFSVGCVFNEAANGFCKNHKQINRNEISCADSI